MVTNKERPFWFTLSRRFHRSEIIEIPPEPVKGYTELGWLGDESSGVPIEEFEKKIGKNDQRTVLKNGSKIIDLSKLSDEDFNFFLEQIQPKTRNRS